MTAVQVGHDFLDLPIEVFEAGDWKGAIIDSGTTLAYLPEMVYEPLVSKVDIWKDFNLLNVFNINWYLYIIYIYFR